MHLPQVALQVAITNMLYKYGSLPLWTMRKRTGPGGPLTPTAFYKEKIFLFFLMQNQKQKHRSIQMKGNFSESHHHPVERPSRRISEA
jgi:hypothetical protein